MRGGNHWVACDDKRHRACARSIQQLLFALDLLAREERDGLSAQCLQAGKHALGRQVGVALGIYFAARAQRLKPGKGYSTLI